MKKTPSYIHDKQINHYFWKYSFPDRLKLNDQPQLQLTDRYFEAAHGKEFADEDSVEWNRGGGAVNNGRKEAYRQGKYSVSP